MDYLRSPVRPSVGAKNLDQLYSSINRQRTTRTDIVWSLEHVWWCLVVSGGVNVYRLILSELIDVYGQISLSVHVTDAADAPMLLMQCCC